MMNSKNIFVKFIILSNYLANSFTHKTFMKKYGLYSSNYNENLGECIYNIRNEIKYFPYKDINYDLYDPNFVFLDPNGLKIESLEAYKLFIYMVKLGCRTMVKNIKIDYKLRYNTKDNIIIIRWNSTWDIYSPSKRIYYDAISNFQLNEEGKIKTHEIKYINTIKDDSEDIFNLFHNQMPALVYDTYDKNILPQICEFIWDCHGDMECCDYGFIKVCCTKNIKKPNFNPDLIPIPIPIDPNIPKNVQLIV